VAIDRDACREGIFTGNQPPRKFESGPGAPAGSGFRNPNTRVPRVLRVGGTRRDYE